MKIKSRASRSKTAMHKRLSAAESAKSIVKPMIRRGDSVVKIKEALRDFDVPVTAYNTLRDQGFVSKWRASVVGGQ